MFYVQAAKESSEGHCEPVRAYSEENLATYLLLHFVIAIVCIIVGFSQWHLNTKQLKMPHSLQNFHNNVVIQKLTTT